MNRRKFLKDFGARVIALAVVSGLGGLAAMAQVPANKRPNIIFIVADDMGYGDCGVYGCTDIPTPGLDRLANDGVRFTDGYVTGSVCSPSRAALMTGRYQQRDGVMDWVQPNSCGGLELGVPTVADYLRKAGYKTAIVGKWHLGEKKEYSPVNRGFDEFFGFLGGGRNYWPEPDQTKVGAYKQLVNNGEPVVEKEYTTFAFGREAVNFINRQKGKTQPFFLYLAFSAVHAPLQPPPQYGDRLKGIRNGRRRAYAGMLTAMDEMIGKVQDAVNAIGAEDETLICFISDNGGPITRNAPNNSSNGSLRGGKGETWEGGIRVPFSMTWKGRLKAGAVVSDPVIQMDLTATALALAGVTADPKWPIDGIDLMPFLTESKKMPERALFWNCPTNGRQWAIRRGDFKLTCALPEKVTRPISGLYDLRKDIGEQQDLASSNPELFKQLQEEWEAWNKQVMAGKPVPAVKKSDVNKAL